jgi:hypothetical protein
MSVSQAHLNEWWSRDYFVDWAQITTVLSIILTSCGRQQFEQLFGAAKFPSPLYNFNVYEQKEYYSFKIKNSTRWHNENEFHGLFSYIKIGPMDPQNIQWEKIHFFKIYCMSKRAVLHEFGISFRVFTLKNYRSVPLKI